MNKKVIEFVDYLKNDLENRYKKTGERTWKFEVITENTRSQVVTLSHIIKTHSNKDISRFRAFSPIGIIKEKFDFQYILRLNSDLDVGTIAIRDLEIPKGYKEPHLIFQASHLVATADYPEIWELVTQTASWSDKLEKKIYSKDKF